MRHFSRQTPETRNMLYEWIMLRFCKEENLIALNYDFVNVIINGEKKGIYAIEQSFDSQLLIENKKMIGPIIKICDDYFVEKMTTPLAQEEILYMSEIDCFESKKTFKSELHPNITGKAELIYSRPSLCCRILNQVCWDFMLNLFM